MPLDPVSQIGQLIGNLSNEQDEIKQNLSGDETEPQDIIVANNVVQPSVLVVVNKSTYATDSFIIDHPVYGELDSSTLKLDGGYAAGQADIEIERTEY